MKWRIAYVYIPNTKYGWTSKDMPDGLVRYGFEGREIQRRRWWEFKWKPICSHTHRWYMNKDEAQRHLDYMLKNKKLRKYIEKNI